MEPAAYRESYSLSYVGFGSEPISERGCGRLGSDSDSVFEGCEPRHNTTIVATPFGPTTTKMAMTTTTTVTTPTTTTEKCGTVAHV